MASPESRAHDSGEGRHIEDSNQSTSVKGEGGGREMLIGLYEVLLCVDSRLDRSKTMGCVYIPIAVNIINKEVNYMKYLSKYA